MFVGMMALLSCQKSARPYEHISDNTFSSLRVEHFRIDTAEVRAEILRMTGKEGVLPADRYCKKHYRNGGALLWIDRMGLLHNPDTLLQYLKQAEQHGINTRQFWPEQITADLERVRQLQFDDGEHSPGKVLARLEYLLTRASIRYSAGLNFGFVNPDHFFNRIELREDDSTHTKYKSLCYLKVKRPNDSFNQRVMNAIVSDSLNLLLQEVQPKGRFYRDLAERLQSAHLTANERKILVCNMEKCRWQSTVHPLFDQCQRYVVVNIPSYSLRAVDGDKVLNMRVGCGTLDHKSPLLVSTLTRMDINPQWIIPKSIAKGYVGRVGYMHQQGIFVLDKKQGKLSAEHASYQKVMDGEQYLVQAGGPKNSLGRIVFRFDNHFSVYLHDTSSPWLLQRNNRALSHGCIRLEKPLALALFLLGPGQDAMADKITYSMTMDFVNDNDSVKVKPKIDKKRIVNTVPVKPSTPLWIAYYTVYYDNNNQLVSYPDVYGYDQQLIEHMAPYI